MDVGLGVGVALACLALLALVAAAEGWLTSHPQPGPGGGFWQESLRRLLRSNWLWRSTLTLTRSLALGGYATLIAFLALRALGPNRWGIAGVVGGGLVAVVVVEWLLWALARQHLQRATSLLVKPFLILTWALAPLRKGLDLLLIRPFHLPSPGARPPRLVGEEAQASTSHLGLEADPGAIQEEEREMIRGVMGLEAKTAREVMVPRVDIFALEAQTPVAEAVEPIVQEGYSRVPIYQETIDNIVGIVYVKDLLRVVHQGPPYLPLKEVARPVLFTPDSKKVDDLLAELRQRRIHMVIVVDEYGGTAGLVTIEDLVEEIVGEIQDEYDFEEPLVEKVSQTEAILDGRASLHDLNEALGLDFHGEDYDTVSGLLLFHLGRLVAVGDEVKLNEAIFRVLSIHGRRVRKVKVTRELPEERPVPGPPSPDVA